MKSVPYLLFLLIICFRPTAIQAQELDVFGYENFKWGSSLSFVKSFLDQQRIRYRIVNSRTRPGLKLLWANMHLRDLERGFPPLIVEQTFTFDKDSLISFSLQKKFSDKKARNEFYDTFKEILSMRYKSTPEDMYMYKGSSEEVRNCLWKFSTTIVSLQVGPDDVFVRFSTRD